MFMARTGVSTRATIFDTSAYTSELADIQEKPLEVKRGKDGTMIGSEVKNAAARLRRELRAAVNSAATGRQSALGMSTGSVNSAAQSGVLSAPSAPSAAGSYRVDRDMSRLTELFEQPSSSSDQSFLSTVETVDTQQSDLSQYRAGVSTKSSGAGLASSGLPSTISTATPRTSGPSGTELVSTGQPRTWRTRASERPLSLASQNLFAGFDSVSPHLTQDGTPSRISTIPLSSYRPTTVDTQASTPGSSVPPRARVKKVGFGADPIIHD